MRCSNLSSISPPTSIGGTQNNTNGTARTIGNDETMKNYVPRLMLENNLYYVVKNKLVFLFKSDL